MREIKPLELLPPANSFSITLQIFFLIPDVFHYLSPSKGRWNWKSPPAPFRSHITELLPFCLLFSHLRRLQSREKSTPVTDIPLVLLPKFPAGCFVSRLPLLMDPWLFLRVEGEVDPCQGFVIPQSDLHLEKRGGTRQSTQGTSREFKLGWSGRRHWDLDGQSSGAFGAWEIPGA